MLKIIQCKKIDSNQINQNLGKLFDSKRFEISSMYYVPIMHTLFIVILHCKRSSISAISHNCFL